MRCSRAGIEALRRVLLAFSVHNPEVGYCQSINFLAGEEEGRGEGNCTP